MPHCWLATASAASAFFWLSEGVKRPGRDGDTFSDAAAQLGVGLPQEDADFFREFFVTMEVTPWLTGIF